MRHMWKENITVASTLFKCSAQWSQVHSSWWATISRTFFNFSNTTQYFLNRNCLFFLPTSPAISMLLLFPWIWPQRDFMSVKSNSLCFLRLTFFLGATPSRFLRAMAWIRIALNVYTLKCPFKNTHLFSLENMYYSFYASRWEEC